MKVLCRTFIDVHVQRVVCMVVVICLLRMHCQVRQLTSALADTERPKHAQGLPKKGSQQEERAQTVCHAGHFKGGSSDQRKGNASTLAMSVLSGYFSGSTTPMRAGSLLGAYTKVPNTRSQAGVNTP